MANLKSYAKRVASLREAMEVTLESWRENQEETKKPRQAEALEERINTLEDAISTLESLEMDLEQ